MKNFYVLLLAVFLCFGCATKTKQPHLTAKEQEEIKIQTQQDNEITPDLFPQTSKAMHDFNMNLVYALKPALDEYKQQKFSVIHKGVVNFLHNLQEPMNAGNAFLQLDIKNGFKTVLRFVINTTAGMFGFMDAAGAIGIKRDPRDFGQTLGVWGVPMGGFFVVPVFGQTTSRDLAGTVVDILINPVNEVFGWATGLFIDSADVVMSVYESYDLIIATNETSIDSYATFKTMYLQNREKKINEYCLFCKTNNGNNSTTDMSSDYDFDME
ncbi:MAG: VacJ family lipoprotein [Alphaproteobacteria bacterium]